MTEITLVKDDKGYDLQFTLLNYDRSAFDLTSQTVYFKAQMTGSTEVTVNGLMTIVGTATDGICKYTVQDGDFPIVGDYYASIVVQGTGTIVTFSDIAITVVPSLPR